MRWSLSTKITLAFLAAILLFVASTIVQARAVKAIYMELGVYRYAFATEEAVSNLEREIRTLAGLLGRGGGMKLAWTRKQLEENEIHNGISELQTMVERLLKNDTFGTNIRNELSGANKLLQSIHDGNFLATEIAKDPRARAALAPMDPATLGNDGNAYEHITGRLLSASQQENTEQIQVLAGLSRKYLQQLARDLRRFKVRFGQLKHGLEASLGDGGREALRFTLILHGTALGVAVLLLIGVIVSLRPIRALIDAVRQVAKGDLNATIPVKRKDEIGELATEVNQMAEALKAQRQALVKAERLAAVGKMAALVAHEIRNPLNAIALNAELIEESLNDPDPEQVRPLLGAVRKEVERLTDVTEAYLRFARLPRPDPEPIDLAGAARDLLNFQQEEARRFGVTIKLESPKNLSISADPDQIRQALLNLLRNAIEAAGDGGHVTLKVEDGEKFAKLIVEDDGPGISEKHKEEIFEPFFSQKKHGTGLGLSVARRVAEGHGGGLKLEAQPAGRTGARFVLELKK